MDSYQGAAAAREDLGGKKRRKRGNPSLASDELSKRVAATGMIQPGAHPEFDVDTPLEKVSRAIGKMLRPRKRAAK